MLVRQKILCSTCFKNHSKDENCKQDLTLLNPQHSHCQGLTWGMLMATGTNLWDAQQTVDSIIEDFPPGAVAHLSQKSKTLQLQLNKQTVVDYQGYCKIDKYEVEQGHKHGKPREKITDVGKMLQIAQ